MTVHALIMIPNENNGRSTVKADNRGRWSPRFLSCSTSATDT
jgi:hypothetical protein